MGYPKLMRVKQAFEAPVLNNPAGEVTSQITRLRLEAKITPGRVVAVACSSRGITNYHAIVRATLDSLKKLGLKPFIIPAMGSHGSSTAEGQEKVLAHSGISESTMDVPVRSSLDVVQVGETEDQIPVFMDKLASHADSVVLINRVKAHTDFEGDIESGLMKMMAIGLGKQKGAATCHQAIFTHSYPRVIATVARTILQTEKILFGVAIVENAYSQTAQIAVLRSSELEEKERALLKEAKRLAARLPFDHADILIIDEMGKDISGTGFDTKVVGRVYQPLLSSEPTTPRVKRILVSDLTEGSDGNADGVGLADFITRRLADKIDMRALYANAIAGLEPERAKIPLTLSNDRDALELAIKSVGMIPPQSLKIIRIKNTMSLGEADISEGYKEDLSGRDDLTIVSEAKQMSFNAEGNLPPF
ncbi:MAG: lactate racemase domain-containing protein [Acidobacteriota bacterium]